MDLPTGNYFKGQSPFLAELYVGPKGPTHKSFQILERWRVDSGQAWVMVSLKTPSETGGGAPAPEVVEPSSFGSRPSPISAWTRLSGAERADISLLFSMAITLSTIVPMTYCRLLFWHL
jgi:hypothetical protein